MMWRDVSALRSGGFDLLLCCNWIKKAGGWRAVAVIRPLGSWAIGQEAAVCSNVIFRLWLQGVVSSVRAFQ